jgi:hypothetical protein
MGHTRLGNLPKSRKWRDLVESLSKIDHSVSPSYPLPISVDEIASKTLEAAEAGMERAVNDVGLRFSFFLLTQIALAAREENWSERLSRIGIMLSPSDSVFELTAELNYAIDDYVSRFNSPTDISEMAQKAAAEAIAELSLANSRTLFGDGQEELKAAIKAISTKRGFADLGQKFFGKFMSRFLNFYLSRATAAKVGNEVLLDVHSVTTFNESLNLHCEQSARIVRDFCAEWYSKTEYREGITIDNASTFVPVAIRKLQSELRKQREEA